MLQLSVVVATFNEEKNISRCLDSIKDIADEIILVDASSSDKTVIFAKKYNAKIYFIENNQIFHKNKQFGLDKASGNWILQLDADEVVSEELKKEIVYTIASTDYDGFYIPRKNYFLGKFMKKGGLYPDGVLRLFKTGKGYFPCKSVHEQIEVKGKTGWLNNPLLHYPYPTLTEYLTKADRYTTLTSRELANENIKINTLNTIKYGFLYPLKTFFNIFIRHLGIVDGLYGFVWAILSAMHFFLAYAKLINFKKD